MGEKVVGYVRVSTEGQVRDGYSLAYQVEEIERYCTENKLQLLHIYEDKGISGATVDEDGLTVERESLQELLSDMAYQQVKHVIVLNTSRLWRSDMAKVLIQRELKKHAVDVKAIEQPNYSIYAHDPNDFLVRSIVRDIEFKKKEMKYIERELKRLVILLDYQLETMPGIELVTASALIAEIGDIRRFSNAKKLARFAGIAPVYFGSGGKGKTHKSKQGNRALHALFYNLAVQQVQVAKGSKLPRNPVFHAYYQKKLKEGKTKGQALVCIMRRLVNIVYGMMKYKTAYELPVVEEKEVV
ncbi:transposase [Bacillus cereus]